MTNTQEVLAMYDVTGIQKYIFRTPKIKEAIGASRIIEKIIPDALEHAIEKISETRKVTASLEWHDENGPLPYSSDACDIHVLYIGGGNAFVAFSSEELCRQINRYMSRYVISRTYSLQLAVAFVRKTDSYRNDYSRLFEEMGKVKQEMTHSVVLPAMPIMKTDLTTGYPLTPNRFDGDFVAEESRLKKESTKIALKDDDKVSKILDNYITQKGVDSTIAVVHIDGNNMGLRIRECISDCETYDEAVPEMRRISYSINTAYQHVFNEMKKKFDNTNSIKWKKGNYFVRKILVAADDITYVCNGKVALETVKYYAENIGRYTLTGDTDAESLKKYGLSVCAGIAYINSHFPFDTAYEVAESVCENAKKAAKEPQNKDGTRIGNWMDFQICKNVQTADLSEIRKKEYMTASGEKLFKRPYFIPVPGESSEKFAELAEGRHSINKLCKAIEYFRPVEGKKENIPNSMAKTLRNKYPLGRREVELYASFLRSRSWKMPDKDTDMYECENDMSIAKWYDALELMELYAGVEVSEEEEKEA